MTKQSWRVSISVNNQVGNSVPKLAIVSSYNEECGAAYYSSRLKSHFEKSTGWPVDVLRLQVGLLRGRGKLVERKGNAHIEEIRKQLSAYDGVMLQFEPGLYGSEARTSYRRVMRLIRSHPNVVLTVHGFDRVLGKDITSFSMLRNFLRGRFGAAVREIVDTLNTSRAVLFWHRVRKLKSVKVLTFCKADRIILERYYDLRRVEDFPIAYFDQVEVSDVASSEPRDRTLERYNLDPGRTYVSIFGFFGHYKGHLTAIKALEYLPEDYHLLIVGGEHPHGIEAESHIGNYVQQLLTFSLYTREDMEIGGHAEGSEPNLNINLSASLDSRKDDIFGLSPYKHFLTDKSLLDRIHFLGQVEDDEMPALYVASDYVVHPYIKTKSGQSGSGPATFAIEFGCKSLFSNAPVFREMEKYFSGAMCFFNIGNFVELAQQIERYDGVSSEISKARATAIETFNPQEMISSYCALMGFDYPGDEISMPNKTPMNASL